MAEPSEVALEAAAALPLVACALATPAFWGMKDGDSWGHARQFERPAVMLAGRRMREIKQLQ